MAATRTHLDDLARCRARACLIADIEWRHADPAGRIVERATTIHDVPPPRIDEEWVWPIAPAPESDPRLSEYRRVIVSHDPGKEFQAAG